MASIWTILALVVAVLFLIAVVWWDTKAGPSTSADVTPTRPPADAGSEGMRVAAPGDITPGSESSER